VRRSDQWNALRSLLPLQAPFPAGVAQSNQRLPTEVGDQKADLASIDRLRQRAGEHIGRRHRRGGLDRRQQRIQVQRLPALSHVGPNLARLLAKSLLAKPAREALLTLAMENRNQ